MRPREGIACACVKDSAAPTVSFDMRVTFLLLLVMLAACGGGGGSDGDKPSSPTPAPTSSATASAVSDPTATPTAVPAFDEVLLGIGAVYGRELPHGGRETRPLVVRNTGGEWETLGVTLPGEGFATGVVFSSPEIAWLYGGRGEGFDGALWRSDDAGRTWIDVSHTLPSDCQFVVDLTFADPEAGWLVSHGPFETAYFATADGGRTWRHIAVPSLGGGGNYAVAARAGIAEAVRYESGLSIIRLDDPTAASTVLAPPGETNVANGRSFSTAGTSGWIAAAAPTRPNDSVHTRAAIFSSAAPDAPWTEQPVDATDLFPELRTIDVRDERNGIALGVALTADEKAFVPYALVTADDGASWHEAPITALPAGWAVVDALRTRGDGAWATATDIVSGTDASALLRSDDGGRSWRMVDSPFEQHGQIFDLARNTAPH